jgi:hypothetical protein
MFGLLGQALSIFSVGLSKQFWQLVFSRALSGALNVCMPSSRFSSPKVSKLTLDIYSLREMLALQKVW